MEIIITEEQQRIILKENFKSDVIRKVESFKKYTSDIIGDLKNSMNFNFRFGVTYGAGIGVVLNHVIEHMIKIPFFGGYKTGYSAHNLELVISLANFPIFIVNTSTFDKITPENIDELDSFIA